MFVNQQVNGKITSVLFDITDQYNMLQSKIIPVTFIKQSGYVFVTFYCG